MLLASFIHKGFLKINISSKLLLSALLQNLFYAPCRRYFSSQTPAAVDAMAEETGDNPAPAPLLYITKLLYRS